MASGKLTKAQLKQMEALFEKRRQAQARKRLAELLARQRERERRERMIQNVFFPSAVARKARLEAMRRRRDIERKLAAARLIPSTRSFGKGAGMGLMTKAK